MTYRDDAMPWDVTEQEISDRDNRTHECEHCESAYDPSESDARWFHCFCSSECEDATFEPSFLWEPDYGSQYDE